MGSKGNREEDQEGWHKGQAACSISALSLQWMITVPCLAPPFDSDTLRVSKLNKTEHLVAKKIRHCRVALVTY